MLLALKNYNSSRGVPYFPGDYVHGVLHTVCRGKMHFDDALHLPEDNMHYPPLTIHTTVPLGEPNLQHTEENVDDQAA